MILSQLAVKLCDIRKLKTANVNLLSFKEKVGKAQILPWALLESKNSFKVSSSYFILSSLGKYMVTKLLLVFLYSQALTPFL